jgi:hypothetical protein
MPAAIVPVPTTPTVSISWRKAGSAVSSATPAAERSLRTGAGSCSGSPVSACSFSSPDTTTSAPSASMRANGPIG